MRRRSAIAAAAAVAFAGAVVPIGGALWYSWQLSADWEHDELRDVAERATIRAQISMDEVTATLRVANAIEDVAPCSAEHIQQMQVLAFDARVVEEIGYFEDGLLRCTSWGVVDQRIPHLDTFDFTTAAGVEVTALMEPLVTGGKQMMALELGAYNALVDPARFADIIVDDAITVTLGSDAGFVISALHDPDAAAFARALDESGEGMTDDYLYATSRAGGWIAVATEPRSRFDSKLAHQRRLLLPGAALVAVLPVGLVIWSLRRRLSLRGELATAVRKREFVVHYQPLIDLQSRTCIGGEALVRWHRPDGFQVRPDLFVSLAEEIGLVEAITEQVIETVGHDLGELLTSDRSLHVAINLSASDVKSGRAVDVVTRTAGAAGIEPNQLWLEMTERGFIDVDAAMPHLERARAAGHRIAIDDFGTGYSSLSLLQNLPLNILKIDKSFVDTIGTESPTSAVTSHIIDLAKELGLQLVAEGVQTDEQANYLQHRGVDFAQGWLFSPPLDAPAFIDFCRARSSVPPVASAVGLPTA